MHRIWHSTVDSLSGEADEEFNTAAAATAVNAVGSHEKQPAG
jgi:hypothetical protein